MQNRFESALARDQLTLRRGRLEVLQINLGRLCNQTCVHCHVEAGPRRTEIMPRAVADRVLDWLAASDVVTVDITGGAPELNPSFRYLVESVRALSARRHLIDRCNLTVLFEPGQEDLGEFVARHQVEIIASLPCYLEENVDRQRGRGAFEGSIRALRKLNGLGYGIDPSLPLNLVFNPIGAKLPPGQAELEADYKAELKARFGIVFNRLYTLTNLPIGRFAAQLRREGAFDEYLELLANAFNAATLDGLMCRNTLSVGWRGEVYDCDFNQMLGLQWRNGRPLFLWDIDPAALDGREIITGNHCLGCSAGAGSSCGGALV